MADAEKWSMIITPKRKLLDFNIREIIRYRDLVFMFIKRDFVVQYKQTIFGPLWCIITPLLSTFMYTFVFGRLAQIGTDGIPHLLFYYSGTMLWAYFSACLNNSISIFASNGGIFSKVYFPRLVVPMNFVISHALKSFIQFILLMVFFIYYLYSGVPLSPSFSAFLLPLLFLWLAAIGVGAGTIIASLTTKYRDLRTVISHLIPLTMYATPVVYPLSEIPERFFWIAYANPVCVPIELFRQWFYGYSSVNAAMIFASLGITTVLLFIGLILFNQNESTFLDVA